MTSRVHVGFIPYHLRPKRGLAGLGVADLDWPLGAPNLPNGARLADLSAQDHVVVHPNTALHVMPWGRLSCRLSLLIAEPDAIHAKHLKLLKFSHRRFHRILTRSPQGLSTFKNARRFVTGATHLTNPNAPAPAKTQNISLIASAKRDQTGHNLRHDLVDYVRAQNLPVDVMGRGYRPFEHKEDGLAPYRYSFVIENVQEPSYFTEKIIDAFLCRTVPIYWGAPDIGSWFDLDGMIHCQTQRDLEVAIARCSAQDYAARAQAIAANYALAAHMADTHGRAAQVLISDQSETPPFG